MTVSVDSRLGRGVQRVASTAWFGKLAPKVVPPADRALHKVSGGRWTLGNLLVPTLVLTTTGRRSGEPRQSPLGFVTEADGCHLVVGSNFGQAHHPAWTANLLADPRATVSLEGHDQAVEATLLDADEKAAVWPQLLRIWPTYDRYVERSGRDVRVFRLRPVSER